MTTKQRILAVDVCGTLFQLNTTAGLVIFHHARCANRWRGAWLRALSHPNLGLRFLLVAIAKLTRFDLHRACVVASLRNENVAAVKASAKRYAEDHLAPHIIRQAHDHVDKMQDAGWQPVLVSNAISPIVAAIADQLGLPYVASEPAQTDGRYTGRLCADLTGQKRAALERFLDVRLENIAFSVITDNRSDWDLGEAAKPAVLVVSGQPRKWMRKWDAEYLCH